MPLGNLAFLVDTVVGKLDSTFVEAAPVTDVILPELPASPWRSLGKRFDYAGWKDRDRFLELDKAILVIHERYARLADRRRGTDPDDENWWAQLLQPAA